jgi:hypothetical protein
MALVNLGVKLSPGVPRPAGFTDPVYTQIAEPKYYSGLTVELMKASTDVGTDAANLTAIINSMNAYMLTLAADFDSVGKTVEIMMEIFEIDQEYETLYSSAPTGKYFVRNQCYIRVF